MTNLGNGPDSFSVAAASVHGWVVTLYRDWNGNGVLDGGDSVLTRPVALTSGATAALLVQIAIPSLGSAGVTDTITVTATSRFDGAVRSAVRDVLAVSSAPIAFNITKQVDRPTAAAGDILTYTLDYTTSGTDSASAVQLADSIPIGTSYVAGTIRVNGVAVTDAADGDAGRLVAVGNGVVAVNLGTVAAGAAGSVTFQSRVNSGAPATVANRGNIAFTWSGGTDTTLSNTVQTTILAPALSLSKQLTSPALALVGQQVRYRLKYGNAAGAGSAQNVVLTDTLPVGLQYGSATVTPVIAGQVLTWPLGTLAPADSGVIDLVLTVAASVRDTAVARNVAYLQGQGTPVVSAPATPVELVGPPTAALGLDLTADALEVGVGEAIPYTIVVRNPGTLVVTNLQIAVQLPVGARYVSGSAIGADSVVVAGGRLILYSAVPLVPGTGRTLRYVAALISARGTVVESRAVATGQVPGGLAGSPEAIAWVQIRRAWPMETRAAIGKVWVDANGDGVQDAGEAGLGNVDIWTEDGMVATTDSTGKFSFSNVRPGRHAFRVDPRSIPGGYRLAGEDIQLVDASGWATPRVDFRLVPTSALALVSTPVTPAPSGSDRRAEAETSLANATHRMVEFSFAAVPLPEPQRGDSLAFEHALPAEHRPRVRYDVKVRQSRGIAFDAVVSFKPRADSAVVFIDDKEFSRYSWRDGAIAIPFAHPGADIRIAAWSSARHDSATLRIVAWPPHAGENATQRRFAGRSVSTVRAAVQRTFTPMVVAVALPAAAGEMTAPIATTAPVPPASSEPSAAEDTVLVARVRTGPEGLASEQLVSLVRGPGIHIFAPNDGAVLSADRVYVGVKAEPNVPVVLYDGATVIDTVHTRIDGVFDFIAVPLSRGPHRLRVAVKNSWGQERWDSIAVHVTGLPARFEIPPSPLVLVADGRTTTVLHLRVLDGWGVPVAQPAYVTVSA